MIRASRRRPRPRPVKSAERSPETGWAHTTVKTLLSRLLTKGAVDEHKEGRTSVYAPLISRAQARRIALHSLVNRAFGGTFGTLVQHMVGEEDLAEGEREKVLSMLAELEQEAAGSGDRGDAQ